MTSIRYIPVHDDDGDEWGEFWFDAIVCQLDLRKRVALDAIPLDALLLKWIEEAKDGDMIPHEFGDRARLMVADLVENNSVLRGLCRQCGESCADYTLAKQSWDDTYEVNRMRVGTSGYQFHCSNGHCLLIVCDRIY